MERVTRTVRKINEASGHQSGTAPPAGGWHDIAERLKKHDETFIQDLADDINTLLVFAGLFSAVITAFIIESYTWLQPDNSQITVNLLSRISAQLDPTANATALSCAHDPTGCSPSFRPSAPSRVINILWFLSLFISLAAAMFGMITKQWLREYLRWDSILATRSDNAWLRQLRYQELAEWDVASKIGAMPAALEIAVILFLCGIMILLWTLDLALAIVVTVPACAFLAYVLLITLWPVFNIRCPYKSPTGWAFAVLKHKMGRLLCFVLSYSAFRNINWSEYKAFWDDEYGTLEDWRTREVQKSLEQEVDPTLRDLIEELDEEGGSKFTKDVVRLPTLLRSLAWVSRDSPDDLGPEHFTDCIMTIHCTQGHAARLLATLYTSFKLIFPRVDALSLLDIAEEVPQSPVAIYTVGPGLSNVVTKVDVELVEAFNARNDWTIHYWAYRLLSADLLLFSRATFASSSSYPEANTLKLFVQALCLHGATTRLLKYRRSADIVTAIYEQFTAKPENDVLYPGMRTILLQVLAQSHEIRLEHDSLTFTESSDADPTTRYFMAAEDYAQLAQDVYRRYIAKNDERYSQENKHLFVTMADMAFRPNAGDYPGTEELKHEKLGALLLTMADALGLSLAQGWVNCGSYGDLPWIGTLLNAVYRKDPLLPDIAQIVPAELLKNLRRCVDRGLITGPDVAGQLTQLRDLCRKECSDRPYVVGAHGSPDNMREVARHHGMERESGKELGVLVTDAYSPDEMELESIGRTSPHADSMLSRQQ
ncbi:hypothetical protein NM688_g7180 [Phlebia brevispora]|uniref:Uncharacterized protein n=1 Tax=Phlebia brevispora TaxID=194682 RepID=A0ACC1S8C7_9APHY|nr:hypothetical protein NM688_g7180 [Phlebia brevispora]